MRKDKPVYMGQTSKGLPRRPYEGKWKCPKCGSMNLERHWRCRHCGHVDTGD